MEIDFSGLEHRKKEEFLNEYIDKYVTCGYFAEDISPDEMYAYYKQIIECLTSRCEEEELLKIYKKLAQVKLRLNIPYIIVTNEIYGLKNMLIRKGISQKNLEDLLNIFYKINNAVAKTYLDDYIKKLIATNDMRIASLSDQFEWGIVKYYKEHLVWLNDLAQHIKDKNKSDFPELDHTRCRFGQWLHGSAQALIQSEAKYNILEQLHIRLHAIAYKIRTILKTDEFHIIISYLEKCELISLNIGTELILVDNIQINKKVTKDALTGALNRHALRSIFETQYELALAVESSFMVVMSDLDNFKRINDKYGHTIGDRILKLFVDTVKKHIRNSDVIIRYGGEEFIIILPSIDPNRCKMLFERIREDFADSFIEVEGKRISTTVSMGCVHVIPEDLFKSALIDEYIGLADKRLYRAKEFGKNKIEC